MKNFKPSFCSLFSFVLLSTALSCKTDITGPSLPKLPVGTCLLTKVVDTESSGSDIIFKDSTMYEYDSSYKLITITNIWSAGFVLHLNYAANGNLVSTTFSNGGSIKYTYDGSNRVVMAEEVDASGVGTTFFESATYSSSGQLISYFAPNKPYKFSDFPNYVIALEYENDSAKNPKTITAVGINGAQTLTSSSTCQYDTKKSPYSFLINLVQWSWWVYPGFDISSNNITSETHCNSGGACGSATTYTYEYNAQGYPIKATSTYAVFNPDKGVYQTNVEVQTFSYNCK